MGSTRLPGKVLKPVCGKTVLEHQMERMLRARSLEEIVVATSSSQGDDPIEAIARTRGWPAYRGPEADVLARYAGAAAKFDADPVVRMTMDCPLIDPNVVDQVVETYLFGAFDLVANNLEPSFPHGLDLEVFSRAVLDAAARESTDPFDREHVTPFIRARAERFRLGNVQCPRDLHHHRWTLDYPEDLEFVRAVYEGLYREGRFFTTDDVLAFLEARPDVVTLNAARAAP